MEILELPPFMIPLDGRPYLTHQTSMMIEEYAAEWLCSRESCMADVEWTYIPGHWTNFEVKSRNLPRWQKKWFGLASKRAKRLSRYLGEYVEA